jgi:membrane-associated phospholipid phosphatase
MNKPFFLIIYSFFIVLTPLHAGDSFNFPFTLSLKTDVSLISVSAVLGILAYSLRKNQASPDSADILCLKISDINAFDRSAAYYYSPDADLGSDIALRISRYSPCLLFIPMIKKKEPYPAAAFALMYLEALAINASLTSITKSLTNRPRPYEYGCDLSLENKLRRGKGGFRAFYSGHTSNAFCSATFMSKVFSEMYPLSKLKGLVWGSAMTVATTTGILRYTAGKHYPSDVIAGACLGSLVGYLVPVLHNKKRDSSVSVFPVVRSGESGFSLVIKL